jgi:hypothetical protein
MFKLQYHLTLLLFFQERISKKDWRNKEEEKLVRSREKWHATNAHAALTNYVQSPVVTQLPLLPFAQSNVLLQ